MRTLTVWDAGEESALVGYRADQLMITMAAAVPGRALLRLWSRPSAALSAGRYHRIPEGAHEGLQRRLSGGRVVPVGPGVLGVSIAVGSAEWLAAGGAVLRPDQILNRALRPLLAVLRGIGVDAFYGGRDLVVCGGRPFLHASFCPFADGAILVEQMLATYSSFVELERLAASMDPAGIAVAAPLHSGIWRSTDGTSWANITPGTFPTNYNRVVLAVAPSNQNVVYFLVQRSDTSTSTSQVRGHQLWKYTYLSGDWTGAGGSWENRGGNLPLESGLAGNARFDSQGGYDMWIQVKPDNENFLIVGAINLYRSTDAFATTTNRTRIGGYANASTYGNYSNHHADQHSGAFKPGSTTIYFSGHDGGLSRTSNITSSVVNWTTLNNGYQTSQFYTLALDQSASGNVELIGGTQDNGTWWTSSASGAVSWVSAFGGDGAFCAISNGRSYYYLSSQNGNMYRVQWNSSGVWTDWANIQSTGGSGYLFINPFTLDPPSSTYYYIISICF